MGTRGKDKRRRRRLQRDLRGCWGRSPEQELSSVGAGAGGQSGGNEWAAQVSQGPGGKAATGRGRMGMDPLGF